MNRSRIGESIAAAGRNAVVIAGVATSTWSAPAAMVLYLIENVIAVVLAGIRVRVQTPPDGRSKVLSTYWMIAGGFTVVEAVFVLFFVLHVLDEPLTFRRMAEGAGAIAVFEVIGFLITLAVREPLSLHDAEHRVLMQPLGRVSLLFFAVFIGVFGAGFVHDKWFGYPFIGLKAAVDIGSLIPRRGTS